MLATYEKQTQRLLQNPSAPQSLYALSDIDVFINSARGQLAGESESIRRKGTLNLVAGQRSYDFSTITLTSSTGIQGVINIRNALYALGTGYKFVRQRSYEWFTVYMLNNPVAGQAANQGPPTVWAQYGQGALPQTGLQAAGGTIDIAPLPDQAYALLLDCVCYPIPLTDDSTAEAIPYLWTDAVPYFAAYLALLSAQSTARQADADRMFARYTDFVNRARAFATPGVLPGIYPQSTDPTMTNKLGLQTARGGGQ